jgi:hypothetical protein
MGDDHPPLQHHGEQDQALSGRQASQTSSSGITTIDKPAARSGTST